MNKFEISNLDLLCYFLGWKWRIKWKFEFKIKYIIDLLKMSNMLNYKTIVTPMSINKKLEYKNGIGLTNAKYYIRLLEAWSI